MPEAKCVELKSLKLYLQQFRNEGIFYENATNRILDDLVAVLRPRRLTLTAAFTPRGGITTTVTVKFQQSAQQKRRMTRRQLLCEAASGLPPISNPQSLIPRSYPCPNHRE